MEEDPKLSNVSLESINDKLDVILAELKGIQIQTKPVTYSPLTRDHSQSLPGSG